MKSIINDEYSAFCKITLLGGKKRVCERTSSGIAKQRCSKRLYNYFTALISTFYTYVLYGPKIVFIAPFFNES